MIHICVSGKRLSGDPLITEPHFYHVAVNSLLGAARERRTVIDGLLGSQRESSHLLRGDLREEAAPEGLSEPPQPPRARQAGSAIPHPPTHERTPAVHTRLCGVLIPGLVLWSSVVNIFRLGIRKWRDRSAWYQHRLSPQALGRDAVKTQCESGLSAG